MTSILYTNHRNRRNEIREHKNDDHRIMLDTVPTKTSPTTITGAGRSMDCEFVGSLSDWSYRCHPSTTVESLDSCDDEAMLLNDSVPLQRKPDDASTPSLRTVGEEDDDDDDELSDCMGSLTCHETDEMLRGFEQYVHHHHVSGPASGPIVTDHSGSSSTGFGGGASKPSPVPTPNIQWSPRTWLYGLGGGVRYGNSFEPDFYTLDGLRKDLFFEYE